MKHINMNIQKLMEEGKRIQLKPKGYSMYPMLVPERASVVLEGVGDRRLRRGDVVLYRREEGRLILHRICSVMPEGLYLIGDNQRLVEGPVERERILGILTAFSRGGGLVSVKNPIYRLYSCLWPLLRPVILAAAKWFRDSRSGFGHGKEVNHSD